MATPLTETRTVRFFEVVDHKSGDPFDVHLDWDGALVALSDSGVAPADRTVNLSGEDHHGGAWMGTPNMLLFSKIRPGYDVPDVFNRSSGELTALQLAETEGVAETTHLAFFPDNIVGMVRTTASPGATSLARWINNMDLLDELTDPVDVIPLSRVSVDGKIQDVERANGIKIRARSTAIGAMHESGATRLADALDVLTDQFGPVTVEMRVYVTAGQPATDLRGTIMEEARGLLALTADGQAVEGLESATLFYQSLERERAEELNMMKDKFAERVDVEVLDASGRATRRESAAAAMQRAYDHLRVDLLAAVGRDRGGAG